MNAERLHAVVNALKREMDETNLVSQMQSLVGALRALVQQSNAPNQQNVVTHKNSLASALTDRASDQFSPAWRQLLKEMGGEDFFGSMLKQTIDTTLASNQMTPAVAADELDKLRQRMEKFYSALNQATTAFDILGIGDEDLEPGECEFGVLIPRQAVENRLNGFVGELEELEFILKTISEVATGKPDDLVLKTISSSDLLIYIMVTPASAACLAKAIGEVAGFYKTLLEIRKLHMEIRKQGVPDKATKGIEDYANLHMESGIEKLTRDIIKEFYKGEEGRRNELTNAVKFALEKIAYKIDHGFNLEVRCQPLPADNEQTKEKAEMQKAVTAVQAASANMQFMNLEGKPLLRLPEKLVTRADKRHISKGKKTATTKNYDADVVRSVTTEKAD